MFDALEDFYGMAEILGECIGALCGAICENLGPCLAGLAECMFQMVMVGCSELIKIACWCSFWNSAGSRNSGHGFDGCFYIALGLIFASIVIGTLAMGIYALAQYVQDVNPAVAAGVACALLDQTITGLSFSAFPATFGRSKAMNVVVGAVPNIPVVIYNRCYNNNKGSAKFRVDGKLAAYTKIDQNLYSCTGTLTHQFEYGSNALRVLNPDNSLFASTDKVPTTGSTTTFRDSGNNVVATLAPHATGTGFVFQIEQSGSPALPLVLMAAAAFAQFPSSGNDECNGFVLAGGIVDIILLSLLVAYAAYAALQFYRKRGSITTKFYEPNAPHSQSGAQDHDSRATPVKYGRDDWAAEEYRREKAAAADAAAAAAHHHGVPPTQPPPVAAAPHTAVLIQFDDTPVGFQPQPAAQHNFQTSAFNPPSSPAAQPYFPPSPAPAPSPPSAMTYWEGKELRDKLAPVGYMKLKRFLTLNGVNCGNTLLKDELITLAIMHRGQIDFSPLISDF